MNPPEDGPQMPWAASASDAPPPLPDYDPGPEALQRVPWRWWEPLIIFLFTLVSSMVIGFVAGWLIAGGVNCTGTLGGESVPEPVSGRCDIANAAFIAIFELALGAWALLWVKVRWNAGPKTLGFHPERLGENVRVGLAAGCIGFVAGPVLMGALAGWIVSLISNEKVSAPEQLPFEGTPHWLALAITGFSVIVLAPVAEELFFRGFLYQGLRRKLPLVAAGIVSALVFGVAHVQPPYGLGLLLLIPAIAVLGFVLAWVFERRGSLVPSITAHALFNTIGFTVYVVTTL